MAIPSYMENIFQSAIRNIEDIRADSEKMAALSIIVTDLSVAFDRGNKVLVCGNGGSLACAMHFAEEFTGRFKKSRRPLPVLALADPAHLTCVGNDFGFDDVFARNVEAFGSHGDWLIVLSTSGNSNNLVKAIEAAKTKGIRTVCLLGMDGGRMKGMGENEIICTGATPERIQEIHMLLLHTMVEGIERTIFPDLYSQFGSDRDQVLK